MLFIVAEVGFFMAKNTGKTEEKNMLKSFPNLGVFV